MNLVSDTMGDGISSSAWSRSTSKPEKPTQGAPARAGCPTPAAKSAPSGAHSAQITQVCEWRTRPIAWPSRRRNRFLNSGLRFLTLDARPPRARTLPKPQINFHSRLERRFQKPKTSPIRPENWDQTRRGVHGPINRFSEGFLPETTRRGRPDQSAGPAGRA